MPEQPLETARSRVVERGLGTKGGRVEEAVDLAAKRRDV